MNILISLTFSWGILFNSTIFQILYKMNDGLREREKLLINSIVSKLIEDSRATSNSPLCRAVIISKIGSILSSALQNQSEMVSLLTNKNEGFALTKDSLHNSNLQSDNTSRTRAATVRFKSNKRKKLSFVIKMKPCSSRLLKKRTS